MTSTNQMIFLIIYYAVIMITSLVEHNNIRALYWFGAIILNISILLGLK